MAVQAVSARRLCGGRMHKFVEERFRLIHSDLRIGFSSSLQRGGPQLIRSKEVQPIGSACGNGDIKGRLHSRDCTRNFQGTTNIVQETTGLPTDNNAEKNTVHSARARELNRDILQAGRQGGNIYMPSARTTRDPIAILKNFQEQGIVINSYKFVEVLNLCRSVTAARQVHDWIITSGMDKNPFVANSLMRVYERCGRLQDASRVFDGLENKTVSNWSIMIGGYAKNDRAEDALEAFNRMRQGGAQPDVITCYTILNACACPSALKLGKEVHSYVRDAGLESDVRVATALLQMYAKCGCITEAKRVFDNLTNRDGRAWTVMIGAYAASGNIDDARLLFDRMEKRDVTSWNTLIGAYAERGCGVQAYEVFLQMKREGFMPDAITLISILKASGSPGTLEWVKEIHSHALRAGLESDVRVGTALLRMYAKRGSIGDARLVFDRMEKRNLITWSVMIGAYAKSGSGFKAYRLFLQMNREGFIPDAITYVNILNAPGSAGNLEWVRHVHTHALKAGLQSNVRVGNSLVCMYAKCGSIGDARLVFDRMEKRDVITWSIVIGAYAASGFGFEAYRFFLQMNDEGLIPDAITYVNILNAPGSAGDLGWVRKVHTHALKAGLESNARVGNALVRMYAKSGSIGDARLVFDRMEKRDVITWSIVIGAYAASGSGFEAYRFFLQMNDEGLIPAQSLT